MKNENKIAQTRKRFIKQYRLQLIMIPMVIWAILIFYIPMMGNIIAFQDYSIGKGFFNSPWVGLEHFKSFLTNRYTLQLVRNTLAMSVMGLAFGTLAAVLLALIINEIRNKFFKTFLQTVSYIPHFISMAVCANVFIELLGRTGFINNFLINSGFVSQPFAFLEKEKLFWITMTLQIVWKEVGWNAIIYLAAIVGISNDVYEAAIVDGTTRLQRIIFITIPSILPTIIILLIMDSAKIFNGGFEQQLLMYNSNVMDYAEVINTYVYKRGMGAAQFSFATAVGMFQSIISVSLLVFINKFFKKVKEVSLW
jgi:putative aldouronate transport system permease protein